MGSKLTDCYPRSIESKQTCGESAFLASFLVLGLFSVERKRVYFVPTKSQTSLPAWFIAGPKALLKGQGQPQHCARSNSDFLDAAEPHVCTHRSTQPSRTLYAENHQAIDRRNRLNYTDRRILVPVVAPTGTSLLISDLNYFTQHALTITDPTHGGDRAPCEHICCWKVTKHTAETFHNIIPTRAFSDSVHWVALRYLVRIQS